MANYYDIKEFTAKLKLGTMGSTTVRHGGSLEHKRPTSEFEAQQQVMRYLQQRYKDFEVLDLKITYR